jgi:hypothetical protein
MAGRALFVGFGIPVRGREKRADAFGVVPATTGGGVGPEMVLYGEPVGKLG